MKHEISFLLNIIHDEILKNITAYRFKSKENRVRDLHDRITKSVQQNFI